MNFKTTDYKLILLPLSIILISVILLYFSIISTKIICSDCKFEVKKNESAYQIAYRLVDMEIINEPYSFLIASKLLFLDTSIKPGKYNLSDINSVKGLLVRLTDPSYDYISITIPEGWTIKQIARKLHQSDLVDSIRFNELCSDKNFISTLDVGSTKYLEGYLFPETYFISSNQNENEIITMMVNQFKKIVNLDKLDYQKYGFSFQDLIILASIIQGEAMDIDEMPTVSSVFHNRLNKKMFLDANATIQYIIPGKNRRLMNKDLEIDNLYNTYKHKGLPPGPINNPGLDAIIAASKPLNTDYLYFVKDPDNFGKHVFNETFKGHEKARIKYLRSVRINGFK